MIDRDDPYSARRRPRYEPTVPPALRPSNDQRGTMRHGTSPAGRGDSKDAHLNGKDHLALRMSDGKNSAAETLQGL